MSITKNWDLLGMDGDWQVTAKPTRGNTKIELTIANTENKSGVVTRGNDRGISDIKKLVAEVESAAEITELADLLHTLADAVLEAQF